MKLQSRDMEHPRMEHKKQRSPESIHIDESRHIYYNWNQIERELHWGD